MALQGWLPVQGIPWERAGGVLESESVTQSVNILPSAVAI